LTRWPDPRIKLFLTWRALEFRRAAAEVFRGAYQPLVTEGPHGMQLLAFARTAGTGCALCIVPRLAYEAWRTRKGARKVTFGSGGSPWPLAPWWHETIVVLPPDAPPRWRHVVTGHVLEPHRRDDGTRVLDLGDVFRSFPVALLAPLEP
jgi:(1->4)-alpha-D-glucan 1-alpha-D-glucosylmutase